MPPASLIRTTVCKPNGELFVPLRTEPVSVPPNAGALRSRSAANDPMDLRMPLPFLIAGLAGRRGRCATGNLLDLHENESRLGFHRTLHFFKVLLREFPGAVFELQIAQILVNHVAAFKELVEPRTVRRFIPAHRIE